ncbi:MAG: hypothetical protein ACREOM_12850 [Candidatus Dormibacteraceae bacterium]
MEVPLTLQFSIALFTGLVASTFVPPVRRAVPRPVEVGLWVGFVTVCVVGVINVADPNAREMTTAAAWGIDQVVTGLLGMLVGGVVSSINADRFAIADWFFLLASADILALVLLREHRRSRRWQPQVRLKEWMELPLLELAPAHAAPYALDEWNRRAAVVLAVAGAATFTALVNLAIWARDVSLPRGTSSLARAAKAGQAKSQARLEALRDTAEQLQFAARSWYAAAGAPAINGISQRATEAVRQARAAERLKEAAETSGKLIHIKSMLSAQSLGWYGPLLPAPASSEQGEEEEDDVAQRSDRLAS